MSKIRIKNFGPIKNGFTDGDGFIDIKKVSLFIGNQGSGKSTVAKLISTFTWLEKALVRGDVKPKEIEIYNRFRKKHCAYQNIHNFFRDQTEIEYKGIAYSFSYTDSIFKVEKNNTGNYLIPKVMYVPAERNFVSAVVQPEKLRYLPFPLYTFLEEFIRSNEEIEGDINLPINGLKYKFDKKKRAFKLAGHDYEINLSEASSGLQSAIPLYVVSRNLATGINRVSDFTKTKFSVEEKDKLRYQLLKILTDNKANDSVQSSAIDLLSSLTKNDCFVNIVEEPEQNLFPTSQQQMLYSLLELNNMNDGNKLIMTSHSPYLINFLSIAIQGGYLLKLINESSNASVLKDKLREVIPAASSITSEDVVVYQMNEINGEITKLPATEGIPSDTNFLNHSIREGNIQFDKLLEIEEEL